MSMVEEVVAAVSCSFCGVVGRKHEHDGSAPAPRWTSDRGFIGLLGEESACQACVEDTGAILDCSHVPEAWVFSSSGYVDPAVFPQALASEARGRKAALRGGLSASQSYAIGVRCRLYATRDVLPEVEAVHGAPGLGSALALLVAERRRVERAVDGLIGAVLQLRDRVTYAQTRLAQGTPVEDADVRSMDRLSATASIYAHLLKKHVQEPRFHERPAEMPLPTVEPGPSMDDHEERL